MSNTNDIIGRMKAETTFGTAPSGNWNVQRIAADSLKTAMATTVSDELGSRRVKDVARTDSKVEGGLTARWSYGAQDDWLLAALMADQADTWAAAVTTTLSASITLEAIAAGNKLLAAGVTSLNWATAHTPGRWIRVKGFATNGAEFRCRLVSFETTSTTNDTAVVDGITLVNESAIDSGEIEQGAHINDGNTFRSWSWERAYSDIASNFRVFSGLVFGGMNLSARAGGLTDITTTMLGKGEVFATSTAAGTPVAAPTNRLINGVDHVRAVLVDGTSFPMSEWGVAIQNNLRERNIFGELGPESIGTGQFNATINMNAYYANNTNLAKYLAFTDTSLALEVLDAHGNSYILHSPSGNFTDGSAFPQGSNQDVFVPLAYASKETTLGALTMQFQVARWPV